MLVEEINEPVDVIASFQRTKRGASLVQPEIMLWNNRRYRISRLGLRYPTTRGQRMVHRFTFVLEDTAYELEFDAEALTWKLLRSNTT